VEVDLLEPGVRLRLRLGASGFEVAPPGAPTVVIRAETAALVRLARGTDDADRLFFDRALVMEGDTEFGLLLKNTLDAIGPLWAGAPR
jgi:predicted lipid carrier protein YhbT